LKYCAYNPYVLDAHDLPNDVDHLKRLVLEHRSRVQAQQLEIERLKIQLSRLRRWKFGRSSEQLDLQIAQIELTLQVLQAVTPPVTTTVAAPAANHNVSAIRERRPPVRRALPAHLPRETVVHVSPSVRNGCTCVRCGGKLRKLGQDVAEMLELVPAYFKVIRHVREKHSCANCAGIVQAPAPSRPIERGLPGPGLLGHVVAGKYCYHQPLYRQSEVYGYAGVPIDRSTLTQWVGAASRLVSPLVQAIRRYVLSAQQLHADDTPLPVLDPGRGRTKTGYLWTYVRDERPWGSAQAPAVWFEYSPNRKGAYPRHHLCDFRGVVHSDAYSGLNEVFECFAPNKGARRSDTRAGPPRMTRSLCWAHVRRKLHDLYVALNSPMAREGIERIGELYAIEAEIHGLSPDERRHERQQRAVPRLTSLHAWLLSQLAQLSQGSALAKAIRYAVKPAHWPALTYYCTDGQAEIDNNAAERSLRTVALGRKSYLFAGSDVGGARAATMYSLIGSCNLNKIDPESYLRYVFERIADHPINRIDELLPWNVSLSHSTSMSRAA
jgi:transposase